MPFHSDPPIKKLAADTPSRRSEKARSAERRMARAQRRRDIAKIAATTPGTYEEVCRVIEAEMRLEHLAPGPVPCRNTLRALREHWEAGHESIEDYQDEPRCGAPSQPLPEELSDEIEAGVDAGAYTSATAMHRHVTFTAASLGMAAPSYYKVKKAMAGLGRLRRTAARHGGKAAKQDAALHGTIPCDEAHDIWTEDEAKALLWAGGYDKTCDLWVSICIWVAFIIDNMSRAIVGYHVVDPTRRRDEDGKMMRNGFDTRDVLAAFFSATIPGLAPASTRQFAGHRGRTLRWDRDPTHNALWEPFDKKVGFTVTELPVRSPDNRGIIESFIEFFKNELCQGMDGHADMVLPTDRINEGVQPKHVGHARTDDSAQGKRTPRLTLTEPDQLPRIADVRRAIEEKIRWYNFEHQHQELGGLTPYQAYRASKPRRPLAGTDILTMVEPRSTLVTKYGILHEEDKQMHRFAVERDGIIYGADKTVVYRPDPLFRGILVEEQHGDAIEHVFLPRLKDWSKEQDDGRRVAHLQNAQTGLYSDQASAARGEPRNAPPSSGADIDDPAAPAGNADPASQRTAEQPATDPQVGVVDAPEVLTTEETPTHPAAGSDGEASDPPTVILITPLEVTSAPPEEGSDWTSAVPDFTALLRHDVSRDDTSDDEIGTESLLREPRNGGSPDAE